MERLTERVLGFTRLKVCGNDFCKETCAEHDEEKSCDNCPIQKAFVKLAEYEDLEEQEKLLKLPCAVGDLVYQYMFVGVDDNKREAVYEIFEAKVFKISIDSYTFSFWTETSDDKRYKSRFPLSAFGKTVFLTREEAEAVPQ